MTKAEVVLWSKLKNRQLGGERFLRQYSVDQYVLDFYCPRLRLAIEADGDSHFATGAREYDKQREEHIEVYGIQFLRFTNSDVGNNLDGVLLSILERIEERQKRLPDIPHSHQNPPRSPLPRRGDTLPGGLARD